MPENTVRHDPTLLTAPVIELPTCFESDEAKEFEDLINGLFRSGARLIVLDTRAVETVDTAGLLAVLDASDRAFSVGAQLLVVPGPTLDTFFEPDLDIPELDIPDNVFSLLPCEIELAA